MVLQNEDALLRGGTLLNGLALSDGLLVHAQFAECLVPTDKYAMPYREVQGQDQDGPRRGGMRGTHVDLDSKKVEARSMAH